MASLNKVMIIGNLGSTPELRNTDKTPVCNFTVATNEKYNDTERTEWHRVVVWGKQAETCSKYLSKGRKVYVEGRLQTRSYDDKSGEKRHTTEIVAERVQFLGGGKRTDEGPIADELD